MIIYIFILLLAAVFVLDKYLIKDKLAGPEQTFLSFLEKRGHSLIIVLTVIYACMSLWNLGDTSTPENGVEINGKEEVVVKLAADANPEILSIYIGSNKHLTMDIKFEVSDNGENWHQSLTSGKPFNNYTNYSYEEIDIHGGASYFKIIIEADDAEIMEMGLFTKDSDRPIAVSVISGDDSFFDEQRNMKSTRTFKNSHAFDELFYVQNGQDIIEGKEPVNKDHPFLASEILGLGMLIFGESTFGFRLINALFSIFMVPMIYLFAYRIFGCKSIALFAGFLMTFDFMHFVQGRNSMLDVFVTVFAMLSMYFFFDYFMSAFEKSSGGSLRLKNKSLFLSGVFLGLGAACKWVALFMLAPMGILWIIVMVKCLGSGSTDRSKPAVFAVNVGIAFFFLVLIPAIIYYLSYLPLNTGEQSTFAYFVDHQKYLLGFHTHYENMDYYESPWYEWCMALTPTSYGQHQYLNDSDVGIVEGISNFGNPLLWWFFIVALFSLIYMFIRKKDARRDPVLIFMLCVCILSIVPWAFFDRMTYIFYFHFYLPFYILMFCYYVRMMFREKVFTVKMVILYSVLLVVTFVLYYPVLAGRPISIEFVEKWFVVYYKWDYILA